MKAHKVVVTIKIEALSIDVVPGLLHDVVDRIRDEYSSGCLSADDGDLIMWKTKLKKVKI